ncbi:MAG: putative quinol monooxygenase [Gammaproteobacteria bacterium]|jgi:quinol monooxygenase YgiN|nr:putative quinol monooxygenase [Gammaproteobacteria bacterium]|tara:strand:- start:117 stop:416 length:300 start_codon:yes stop_codon:yes gene_type:complete
MVIVIGSVSVTAESLTDALRISQEHVHRSSSEPGCISHAVHFDSENPNRLVFVERWESMSDLEQHFQVADSGTFVTELGKLAAIAPEMNIYESDEIKRH